MSGRLFVMLKTFYMKTTLSLVILSIYSNFCYSQQDGTIDLSFGNNGLVIKDMTSQGASDESTCLAIQSDDKVIVGGQVYNSQFNRMEFGLCRFLPDGSIDLAFGNNGIVTTSFGGNDYPKSLLIQPDSKILFAGYTDIFGFNMSVARFNSDGSLDTTLKGTGKLNAYGGYLFKALVDTNLNMVLIGYTGNFVVGTTNNILIKRFNSLGNIDSSFGNNGVVVTDLGGSEIIYTGAIQPDGKILVAGHKYNDILIARYNENGTLDSTFNSVGYNENDFGALWNDIYSLVVLSNGKILATGYISNGTGFQVSAIRFNSNGIIDSTFGSNGIIFTDFGGPDFGYSCLEQNDGKIIVGGFGGPSDDFIAGRYLTNGDPDSTFGNYGKAIIDLGGNDEARAIALQTNGKIIISGATDIYNGISPDFTLVRLHNLSTSLAELDYSELILLPNPTTQLIKWNSKLRFKEIEVYDSVGKLLIEFQNPLINEIDLSVFKNGLYILKFHSITNSYTKKVVKY